MSLFQTQIASFMEILVQSALAEMRKVVDESCGVLARRLGKSPRQNENKSQKVDKSLMELELRESFESVCEPWMAQFSSMLGLLAHESVNKICCLVTNSPHTLHLGVTQKQNENETLKGKLHLTEQEERAAERYIEDPTGQQKKCVNSRTATVTAEDETRQVKQEGECCDSISQGEDMVSLPVEEDNATLQSVVQMDKFEVMKDVTESIIIKEEGLQECLESCVLQEGLQISAEDLNQSPVTQDCEEECGISAEDTEEEGTEPKSAKSNVDIKNIHGLKPFKNTRHIPVMHFSDEDYFPPRKKWTPQPDADVRRHGAVHLPEMVDDTHASRCRRVGCSSKTWEQSCGLTVSFPVKCSWRPG